MEKISNMIELIERFFSIILIAGITLTLFLHVIFRYILNDPIYWASEASIFMMAWATFLGGSLGLKYKMQSSFTFVINRLPAKKERILSIMTHILILIFMAILIYISFEWIVSLSGSTSSSLRIPMWIPYSCVPIGLTFAFIHLLNHLVNLFKNKVDVKEEEGESVL